MTAIRVPCYLHCLAGALLLASAPARAHIGPPLIFFESGDARIDDRTALQSRVVWLLQIWRNEGQPRIFLSGHADRVGREAANLALSRRRAEAVRDYLVGHGVPAADIHLEWYGELRPLVETADGVAEPSNRCVEAVPEGWGQPAPALSSPRTAGSREAPFNPDPLRPEAVSAPPSQALVIERRRAR